MFSCLFSSCATTLTSESFFGIVSTKEIPDILIDTITYYTSKISSDTILCGIISYPKWSYNIKYDTLSRYKAVVEGVLIFKKDSILINQSKSVDSIEITRLVIDRKPFQREFYSNHMSHHANDDKISYKKMDECPLPPSVLEQIRNDFLMRMKYLRYTYMFKEADVSGLTQMYVYCLY